MNITSAGLSGSLHAVGDLRQSVLDQAYLDHPERFVHGAPKALEPPTRVWINKPESTDEKTR